MKPKINQTAAAPRTFVDVYPHVIVIHQGNQEAPEMKFVTAGQRDAEGVLDVITKGLVAQKRRLKVTHYSAEGVAQK